MEDKSNCTLIKIYKMLAIIIQGRLLVKVQELGDEQAGFFVNGVLHCISTLGKSSTPSLSNKEILQKRVKIIRAKLSVLDIGKSLNHFKQKQESSPLLLQLFTAV